MNKLLLLIILGKPLLGNSQDQPIKRKIPMTYNWPYFRLNEMRLTYHEAKNEFSKVPEAQYHFKKYRPQVYIGLVSLIASGIIIKIANNKQAETGDNNPGLYITSAGLSITSLITILSSINHRNKAIRAYNDHIPNN
jgi:hypothetical protein